MVSAMLLDRQPFSICLSKCKSVTVKKNGAAIMDTSIVRYFCTLRKHLKNICSFLGKVGFFTAQLFLRFFSINVFTYLLFVSTLFTFQVFIAIFYY